MQYFDLKNLNYYCDAKGHLEQPVKPFYIDFPYKTHIEFF